MSAWNRSGAPTMAEKLRKKQAAEPTRPASKPARPPTSSTLVTKTEAPETTAVSTAGKSKRPSGRTSDQVEVPATSPGKDKFGIARMVGSLIKYEIKPDVLTAAASANTTECEGILFAFDSGLMVVQEEKPALNVRILHTKLLTRKPTIVKENVLNSASGGRFAPNKKLPGMDHSVERALFEQNKKKELERRRAKGKGVSPEAQSIYEELAKIYKMKWQEPDMILMPDDHACLLSPPYTADSLLGTGKSSDAETKEFRRILTGIRNKLKL